MLDIGVSCQKNSYGRGAGVPLGCSADEDYDAGLCYPKCNKGFQGIGPVCWSLCPKDMHDCGALCTPTADKCTGEVQDIVKSVTAIALDVAIAAVTGAPIDIMDIVKQVGGLALELADAVCDVPRINPFHPTTKKEQMFLLA